MKDSQKPNSTISEKLSKWLSFTGRINQKEFWFYYVLPFVLLNLLPIPFSSLFSIWIVLAGLAKRFHDSDVSFKKKLVPFSIVGIVGMVILAIVLVILFIVTLMGAMTGSVNSNDFSDGFANVFRVIFGIPFLALVIIAIYAGLKPSSPGDNKYGAPRPSIVLSKRYKLVMVVSIMVSIVSVTLLGIGGLAGIGANNSRKPNLDDPELIMAIRNRDAKGLQTLLENGEDPNQKSALGATALTVALNSRPFDQPSNIALLLEYGADPNINSVIEYPVNDAFGIKNVYPDDYVSEHEYAPLSIAIENYIYDEDGPPIETIQLMLEKGADPNPARNAYEETPLLYAVSVAVEDKATPLVSLLLAHGADPNAGANERLLFYALNVRIPTKNEVEVAKLLLEHGADANSAGNKTLLYDALSYNKVEVAKLLLEHGAKIHLDFYHSAFEFALKECTLDMIKMFLTLGVNSDELAVAIQSVEYRLSGLTSPSEHLLEIQRLLINAKKSNGK